LARHTQWNVYVWNDAPQAVKDKFSETPVNRTDYKRCFSPYITLHYITLQYITLHYNTLHLITLHYMLPVQADVSIILTSNKRLIYLEAIWKRCVSSNII